MAEGGQQFGKYRIVEQLGSGGFATVYRAVDTTLDREVALKILHPPLLTDRVFVQRFRQEARTLASLRHPQIVTVYEVDEAEGRLFIAMELAHGPGLAEALAARGRIPWDEALALLKPVCAALDYAHGRNIVHRDLKPANILIDKERGPLLTDFGFAQLMTESSVSLRLSGGIVGTPGYIAPEVWDANAANVAVDIYALGCIVYEMLTGDALFKGQTPMQVMRAHDHGPQFPAQWPEDVPDGIELVLRKALARDPDERYSSPSELWKALNDLERQAQAASWRAEAEKALVAKDLAQARIAIERWRAIRPDDPALQDAQAELGRQVQAAREAAQRAAVVAQWRAEAERALATKEWDAAQIALERWRAIRPDDPAIQRVQVELERLRPPKSVEPERVAPPSTQPYDRTRRNLDRPMTRSTIGPKIVAGLRLVGPVILPLLILLLILLLYARNPLGSTGSAPTATPGAAPTAAPGAAPTSVSVGRPTAAPISSPVVRPGAAPTSASVVPLGSGETIRIYSSLPRQGPAKGQTDAVANAIKLRLEEDNYTACNGQFKIDYVDLDDAIAARGWDEATEIANGNKAVRDPDAMIYIGTFNSGAAKLSMPILNRANLVMISPANVYGGLTKPYGPGEPDKYIPTGKRNYTRLATTDDWQGEAEAKWAKGLGITSVYILDDQQVYGKGIADLFEQNAKDLGIQILGHEGIDVKAQDYRALMTKIKSLNPAMIYFGGTVDNNAGQLIKDMRAVGMTGDKVKFMGPDGIEVPSFIDAAGADVAEGTYATVTGLPLDKLTTKGQDFLKKYKEKYGIESESYGPYGYEAAGVALAAINKVCTKDRAAIRDAVFATKDYDGVLGRWSFDTNGDISLKKVVGYQVQNGNWVPINFFSDGSWEK